MEKLFPRITASELSSTRTLFGSSKLQSRIKILMETFEHQEQQQHVICFPTVPSKPPDAARNAPDLQVRGTESRILKRHLGCPEMETPSCGIASMQ